MLKTIATLGLCLWALPAVAQDAPVTYVVEDSYAMVHRNEVAVKKEGNVSDHLVL